MATVYEVQEFDEAKETVVRTRAIQARNPAQAIKFASKGRFEAEAITAARLGELFARHGVKSVETADDAADA